MAQLQKKQPEHPVRQVRALERGFDNITLREPGEVFTFAGPPGSWFEDVPSKPLKIDDLA